MQKKTSSDEIITYLEQLCGSDWYEESGHPSPEKIQTDPTGKLFNALFDSDEIQAIQDSFANATGVASIITTVEGRPLTNPSNFCELCENIIRETPKGRKNCYTSDAVIGRYNQDGPVIQQCLSGGLTDAGASITAGPVHIANWLIGQVRNEEAGMDEMAAYAHEIGVDETIFLNELKKVTVMPLEQFKQIANFLFMMANQMSHRAYQNLQQRYLNKKQQELERRLHRAEKIKVMGRLAGGVAHDGNNMLGGICGYLDLLKLKLSADDPNRKYVISARTAAQKMSELIQDMQSLTKTGMVAKEKIGLNALVLKYLNSYEAGELLSTYPAIRYKTQLASDLFDIDGSTSHIFKSIVNLLINAAEAMPDGGDVLIKTENRLIESPFGSDDQMPPGEYVILSVTDSGVGISPTDIEKIFEPFYTKKRMGREGTGLGMSVVLGTVQDHGGHVAVQSDPAKGTEIALFFPAVKPQQAEKGIRSSPPSQKSHQKSNKTILVVDDIAEQREIASTVLTMLGFNVDTAASGHEALSHLEKHSADLLVLDMIMSPGIDGLETYQEALKIRPNQKAVIVSGFAETDRVQKTLELGASCFVKKPYTIHEIGKAVKNALADMP